MGASKSPDITVLLKNQIILAAREPTTVLIVQSHFLQCFIQRQPFPSVQPHARLDRVGTGR